MFDLGLFSKYRTELMGVATILIILCHMPAHGVVMPTSLRALIVHGGTGCDIFLLLSGLGMYHSWQGKKLSGGGILAWYRKRFARLLVPYLLICAPLFATFAFKDHWSVGKFLLRLSTLSFWTEGWGLWFVALTMVLYIITPLLDKLLTGCRKGYWLTGLVLATWLMGSIHVQDGFVSHVLFGLCRVPSYLLGYSLAKDIMGNKTVRIWPMLVAVVLLYVVSLLANCMTSAGLSLFWMEGFVMVVLFVWLIDWLVRVSSIAKGLRFMGTVSLESYCTNVFLLPFFLYLPWQAGDLNLNPGNWSYYIVGTAGCVLISWTVNKLSRSIIKTIVANG